jgi:hypothetical protein
MKMNHFRETLSQYWLTIQSNLFPWLSEDFGPLTEKQQQLITVLELSRPEEYIPSTGGYPGRPKKDRTAIARAFVAKAVYNVPTTRGLLDRLDCDKKLRRICGWEKKQEVPHESAFSRGFAEFAETALLTRIHEALIQRTHKDRLVGHISRDSTKIDARERPERVTEPEPEAPKRKRGRPKKGEERSAKEPTRLERQSTMSLADMLDDLPKACNVGTKQNSKGKKESWIGYKLHIDAADGSIPVSCLLTSASLHDSQAAIPLATITSQRTTNLYDLMDSAYDAPQIHDHSKALGHVPMIDCNPRRDKALKEEMEAESKRQAFLHMTMPEAVRYNERSTVERVNGRLKDEFGGRMVRVRGHAKVMCHLMFGILALTVDQLMRFIE